MRRFVTFAKQAWDNTKSYKWLKRLAIVLWAGSLLSILVAGIIFFTFSRGELPSFSELENPQYDLASIVYSDNSTPFGKYYIENREFVDFRDLSPNIINTIVFFIFNF